MTADSAGQSQAPAVPRGRALIEELLREKDVLPIESPDDPTAAGIFESSEELHEFLDYTYAARRAELA